MKFSCTVHINAPIDKVIRLFDNPDNLKEWQDGFQGMEHLSGTPGVPGAKSKITYLMGKRKIELIETVLVSDLPREFTGLYEAKQMVNTMKNNFSAVSKTETRYSAEVEYTEFRGLMPKLMALLFPGMFKKQVEKWMNQFKVFAESIEH